MNVGKLEIGIIGGGVAGLFAAWYLAQTADDDVRISLFDKGKLGHATTWDAAGMLAPVNELEFQEVDLFQAGLVSRKLYDTEVAPALGDIGFYKKGTVETGLQADDVPYLKRLYDFQKAHGQEVEWLSPAEIRKREPFLAQHITAGIWSWVDAQVDNRQLVTELRDACLHLGVQVHEEEEIKSWAPVGDGKITVVSERREVAFDKLLVCPGVPSKAIKDLLPYKIYPVRGEMVSLDPPEGPFLQATVRIRSQVWGNAYVVPKADRILCGSTAEEKGMRRNNTAGGMLDILRKSYAAVPGIYELEVDETWAGLRPSTLNRLPILDQEPGQEIYHLNGLFRHGILLGPLMGKAAAQLLLHGNRMPEIAHFRLS